MAKITSTIELNTLRDALCRLANEMCSFYDDPENEIAETIMSAVDAVIEYKWDVIESNDDYADVVEGQGETDYS
jgi:Flp pilus assembly CpaF family ATPase